MRNCVMHRHNLWIIWLLLVWMELSPDHVRSLLIGDDLSKCVQEILNKTQNFGMKLPNLLLSNSKKANIIISPPNIYTSLALIHLGSGGNTRRQLNRIFGLPGTGELVKLHKSIREYLSAGKKYDGAFTSIEGIFVDNQIKVKNEFRSLAKSIYETEVIKVDFSNPRTATRVLNKIFADITENRTKTLIKDIIPRNTKILIASYAHFKAEWEYKFPESSTAKREFFLTPTRTIMVDTMWRKHSFYEPAHFADIAALKIQTLELKFTNHRYSMFIVLPDRSESSLDDFLSTLSTDTIDQILNQTTKNYLVGVQLPKISFKWSKLINEDLEKLGIDEIFTKHSNLKNMIDGYANVETFMHSGDVEINENGVGIKSPSDQINDNSLTFLEVKFFYVDRPFFFFIYDGEMKSTLFYSAVYNPNEH